MNFLDLRTWEAAFINHIAHETNLGQYHKSTTTDSVVNELKVYSNQSKFMANC